MPYRDVPAEPAYRNAAAYLRDEINALPGPDFAVGLLEELAVRSDP